VAGLFLVGVGLGLWGFHATKSEVEVHAVRHVISIVACGVAILVWIVLLLGFFTLQPNMAAVLILFGKYKGMALASGFHWANPLMLKKKVSVRSRNLNGEKLKVNDSRGNPIEIALVVVWRVMDTAKAVFDVEDFDDYVNVQSEAAERPSRS
jgi:regulator of protease activity HflC (stomatin/prohibitin superfamily)